MQFNRNEYLKGNFDATSQDEVTIANRATKLSGLEWNLYIKNYIIKYISSLLSTYSYSIVAPFVSLSSFLEFGLFSQAIEYLNAQSCGNTQLEAIRDGLINILKNADDIDDSSN